jgi:predicted enzyme related to lactoylglutathione lyase
MMTSNQINYVEFAAGDLEATKEFFTKVFDWQFQDYGPDYIAFTNAGVEGGFFRTELASTIAMGGALIVLFSNSLEATVVRVQEHGGTITKPIFEFPGGRRFHFKEPSGNELAVWSNILDAAS